MPASNDDLSDIEQRSDTSHAFRSRIEGFRYTTEGHLANSGMPPRNRKVADATVTRGEKLTGIDEKVSDSDGGTLAPIVVRGSSNEATTKPKSSKAVSKRKRTSDNEIAASKRPRPTTKSPSSAAPAQNNLKDSVREGLILISIGLNPGIMTGLLGHAYAHPTNRYWPTLYASGITPVLHKPADTHGLMDLYGMGHTNIIPTIASVGASDLTTQDYLNGAAVLDAKIRELKPQAVAIVGKGIWEEWVRYKKGRKFNAKKDGFDYGWQGSSLWIGRKEGGDDAWEGARTFVVTTTSGASTAHTKEQRVAIWKPLGDWFTPKREEWVKNKQEEDTTQD